MEIFKVRNKENLYWEGNCHGGTYYFTDKGKQWKTLSHVKSALKLSRNYKTKEFPEHIKDCEIVKFELKEVETIKIK